MSNYRRCPLLIGVRRCSGTTRRLYVRYTDREPVLGMVTRGWRPVGWLCARCLRTTLDDPAGVASLDLAP
jgi:hypothetical protein